MKRSSATALSVTAVLYVVSLWTGELLGGVLFTARLVLIPLLLGVLAILPPRLDRGTIPMRLWSWITVAMAVNVIPVVMETVNAYAARKVISPDLIFVFYLLVFIPVLVVAILYQGFRRQGLSFTAKAKATVLPSLSAFLAMTLVVLVIPMVGGDIPLGVRVPDIISILLQVAALCLVALMAITIGRGVAGRPYPLISLALVRVMMQTILTAHIRLVGIMSTAEPADFLLNVAYYLLIRAADAQYRLIAGLPSAAA
ncbi:MAG: hypothetical protein ACUVS1_10260 [Actinomycetota bacterium]